MSVTVPAGRTKAVIFESATRLFGTNGYAATTMRDIATAVGVLPGSLYTHIASKEELLSVIVESGIDRFLTMGEEVLTLRGSAEARLRAFISGHVQIVAEDPASIRVVYHQWRHLSGDARQRAVEKRRRYEGVLSTILDEGVASGDFTPQVHDGVSAKTILGALNWTSEWIRPDGPADGEEIGQQMADTLIGGLIAR